MTKVILHGACGRMGHEVQALIANNDALELVAMVDAMGGEGVYTDISDCSVEADVIIDFSSAAATENLLAYAVDKNIPVIMQPPVTAQHKSKRFMLQHRRPQCSTLPICPLVCICLWHLPSRPQP